MYEDEQKTMEGFRRRLAQLRAQKDVSAREMSLALSLSDSYISKIEGGFCYPSMAIFFHICGYLGISAEEFFDYQNDNPFKLKNILHDLKYLSPKEIEHIGEVIKDLRGR